MLGVEVSVQRQFGHAQDSVHWRTNLVAHVGQELALGTAGRLGPLLGFLQLLLGLLALGYALLQLSGVELGPFVDLRILNGYDRVGGQ